MIEKDSRKFGSSAFLFTRDKKKMVLLMSSLHTQPTLGATGKPEVIEYHNATKGGVDPFDWMCAPYSCGRKTKRWPLCMFYGIWTPLILNLGSYTVRIWWGQVARYWLGGSTCRNWHMPSSHIGHRRGSAVHICHTTSPISFPPSATSLHQALLQGQQQ